MNSIDILGVPHAYDLTSEPKSQEDPVLVFIHGWLLSRLYWQPIIKSISGIYPCLSYDLRGFGDSGVSATNGYSLAAYARDLDILLQELNIKKAWLVGHSLGGSIALWGAKIASSRVAGVICLNSGGGVYIKDEFDRFRAAGQQLVKYRPSWLPNLPGIDLLFSRIMVKTTLDSRWGRQRAIDLVRADRNAAIGSLLDSTTEAEVNLLPQVVSELNVPIYFLAGAEDKIMETKYVRHLASYSKSIDLDNVIEIPLCGHLSMVEVPDLVSSKISAILGDRPLSILKEEN